MKATTTRRFKEEHAMPEKKPEGPFKLPPLHYAFNALEPHIDAQTMEIHYGKHHQTYVTNLNAAIAGTDAEKMSIEDICKNVSHYPPAVRNNAGGHYNHSLLWTIMSPKGGGSPKGDLLKDIGTYFGSFEDFKKQFSSAGMNRFGSGWIWLVIAKDKLVISSTPNQDNPLMDVVEIGGFPVLGMDVWEHAYYLKHQNKRADYIAAFWNVIDWTEVSRRFSSPDS